MGRHSEIKESFGDVAVEIDGIVKQSQSSSIVNNTLFVSKDRIYAGGKWKITFSEMKLDASVENGSFKVFSEDGSKQFKCNDMDVQKVERFVDVLAKAYGKWKIRRDDKSGDGSAEKATTKKRARRCYGSSAVRARGYGKKSYGSSLEAKFDDIVSSSEDESELLDDTHEERSTTEGSVDRTSVCLAEEDDNAESKAGDGASVTVTDEDENAPELPDAIASPPQTPASPPLPTAPRKPIPTPPSQTSAKGISNYFPSAKSISRSNQLANNNLLVQDSPTPEPPTNYFKPLTTIIANIDRNTVKDVDEVEEDSRAGLRNMGNSCYLNASLQMLFSLPSLFTALEQLQPKSSLKLLDSILQVYGGNARNASPVKLAMDKITPKYLGFEQRDAHEFVSDVVDSLHTEMQDTMPSNSISPSDVFFHMDLRVSLTCDSCQYRRTRDEMYRHVSLDISNASSLTEALTNFFLEDTVCLSCENCSAGKTATRTMQIVRLPKALLLHLKRFIVSPSSPSLPFRKNKDPVNFPSTLSLRQFSSQDVTLPSSTTSPSLPRLVQDLDKPPPNPLSFSLKAVVHHIGANANCGHYITDACIHNHKNTSLIDDKPHKDAQWNRFDDCVVTKLKWEDVVSVDSQRNAYMLLYELNV